MGKIYQIELTEGQVRVVQKALEDYFRLRMGQQMDFAMDLAKMNIDLSSENPRHNELFAKYLERRDAISQIMQAVFHIAFGRYGVLSEKTDDMLTAECIWDAIRFHRGVSRWDRPFQIGSEPTPKIQVKEGDDK